MPRTKKPKSAPADGPPGEVLTRAEAAAYLRMPEGDVIGAAVTQGLPGRLVGGEWRFLKEAIRQWLSVSQPTAEMRKAAVLSVAGILKDDPDLEQIVEDAMRRRGREPGPDGTYGGYRPPEGEEDLTQRRKERQRRKAMNRAPISTMGNWSSLCLPLRLCAFA